MNYTRPPNWPAFGTFWMRLSISSTPSIVRASSSARRGNSRTAIGAHMRYVRNRIQGRHTFCTGQAGLSRKKPKRPHASQYRTIRPSSSAIIGGPIEARHAHFSLGFFLMFSPLVFLLGADRLRSPQRSKAVLCADPSVFGINIEI